MKTKKSTSLLIIIAVIILVIAFVFLFKGIFKYFDTKNYANTKLYFANAEKTDLKSVLKPIKKSSDENEYLKNILNSLLEGPAESGVTAIIPANTRLLSVKRVDKNIVVNLSSHYLSIDKTDNILARNSIAKTLFEIEGVNSVEILVNSNKLYDSTGKEIGLILKSQLITGASETKKQTINLTTYFSDNAGMYLIPEVRTVKLIENNLEKAIIQELIKGPTSKNCLSVIPQDTKLISIETKDKICFVNFSSEFTSKHSGGSQGEMLTVYSIVNSLTELEHIDKVQFMVEGNKIDNSHFDFFEPIERDESWIKQK